MASSFLVRPTDQQKLRQDYDLSPLDQIMPRAYIRIALCIARDSSAKTPECRDVLTSGLRMTLEEAPFLGGRIVQDNLGDLRIAPGPGVEFRSQTVEVTHALGKYSDLQTQQFPISGCHEELLAPSGVTSADDETPVMAAQANFIDGGLILVIAIHQAVMDATALGTLIRTWAHHCSKGEIESPYLNEAAFDRAPLAASGNVPTPNIKKHHEYKTVFSSPEAMEIMPLIETAIFHIDGKKIRSLRRAATRPDTAADSTQHTTTYDLVAALFWSRVTRARGSLGYLPRNVYSRLSSTIDCRNRLEPPLDPSYLNSFSLLTVAALPALVLIEKDLKFGVGGAAEHIHRAIKSVDDQRVRSLIESIKSIPDVTSIIPASNPSLGPDFEVSSWEKTGITGATFGMIGTVERVRILNSPSDGGCIIHPTKDEETDGLEITIGLEKKTMDALRREHTFGKLTTLRYIDKKS